MYIMSKDSCKAIDKITIDSIGIPSIVLMENAANEVYLKINNRDSYVVVCGTGNNGGDGLAIARKLILNSKDVRIIIINPKDNYTEDFYTNFNIIKNLKCRIDYIKQESDIDKLEEILVNTDIIVDCIFGVGINRELDSFYIKLINSINEYGNNNIIAVDVPSGLDSDSGVARGSAIKAKITYTFEVIKLGFINYNAFKYIGDLKVIPIGIPEIVKQQVDNNICILDEIKYKEKIHIRSKYGHKGNYGKAIIFAGSKGFSGAGYLTTEACVKTGAGLTTIVTTEECQKYLSSMLIEAMSCNFNERDRICKLIKDADVIAFGPGLPSSNEYEEWLIEICKNSSATIVVDAEGINILARRPDILKMLRGRVILTPHPGEMARLVNKSIKEVEENRLTIAKKFAKENECILLLKGYNTVITDGIKTYINTTGDSKMAAGGAGDCLTGIITSFVAQGHCSLDSVLVGAFIHGKSAEIAGVGKYSVTATEIIEKISMVINNIIQ